MHIVEQILLDNLMELKREFNLNVVNHITQHSNAYIRRLLLDIDANQSNEYRNYEEPKHIIRLTAFVALVHEFGIQMEGKLVKSIVDSVARHKQVSFNRSVFWSPNAFLSQHAKTLMKSPARFQDGHGPVPKIHSTVLEKLRLGDQKGMTFLILTFIFILAAKKRNFFGEKREFRFLSNIR